MQVTETSAEGLKREYRIVVGADEIESKLEGQLEELRQQIRMPGFRPGKVPVSLLRKTHGKRIMGQVLEEALSTSSQAVFEDRDVRPAVQPKIEVVHFEEGKDLEYRIEVEIMPEIEDVDFSAIALERPVAEVPDTEVDAAVARLAEQQRSFEPVAEARPAREGDLLIIDFKGMIDGEAFEGGAAEDFGLELGSGRFIPGFEEQLIGAEAGQTPSVAVTFPEDYGAEALAGKDAVFEVTVKELREPHTPAIDDELAKRMGVETLADLRAAVRRRIETDYAGLSRQRLKRQLLDILAERCHFEVPPGMVEREFEQIWTQIEAERNRDRAEAGASAEEAVPEAPEAPEADDEEAKQEYREIAERRIRLGLLLADVGEKNNISVSQQELNRALSQQASRFPGQERQVFEFYQNNPQAMAEIRAPLYEDKVVDFIFELAEVTDHTVTPEELMREPDEAPAEEPEKPKGRQSARRTTARKTAEKKAATKKTTVRKRPAKTKDE